MQNNNIPIYSLNDFKPMRKAGSLAAKILDQLKQIIVPGISTLTSCIILCCIRCRRPKQKEFSQFD